MTTIDIAYYQGHPNFAAVKAAGISRVIMKAVDVERGYPVIDSVYVANRAAARAAGLAVGSYLFNGPQDPTGAANFYAGVIDWRPGDIAAIDVENALGVNRWNPGQVLAFCVALIARGIPASSILAYMSSSVTRADDWTPLVRLGVRPWIAQYGSNNGTAQGAPGTGTWGTWALWQYTSAGTVPGINGRVDMNQEAPGFAGTGSTLITPGQEDIMTQADLDQINQMIQRATRYRLFKNTTSGAIMAFNITSGDIMDNPTADTNTITTWQNLELVGHGENPVVVTQAEWDALVARAAKIKAL